MTSSAVYRFTIFERDGVTPWFGSYVDDAVVVPDFQTPDPTLAHPRPYLRVPEGFSPTEIDFLNGASKIGAGSVGVLDKRTVANDQASGLLTSRIKDAPGARALLERWVEPTATWRKILDGKVETYTVDDDELLVYWFQLRDARDFERAQPLFFSNHVIFGEQSRSGPGIDYGRLPFWHPPLIPSYAATHTHLLKAVRPFLSTVTGLGAYNHFERGNDPAPADGIYYGWAFGPNAADGVHFNLQDDAAFPTLEADGVYRFRNFYLKWRPQGSSDPFTVLRGMPIAHYAHAVTNSFESLPGLGVTPARNRGVPTLYFGSTIDAEVPTTGQHIEFYVMAENITDDTPFWWDGGTLGDLLLELIAGEHTTEPPQERYDMAAVTAFALASKPARFKLTAPVTDRRRWVEANIYQASFTAPGFNLEQELRPVPWRMPTVTELEGAPVLDAATIQPIGAWEHSINNAVGELEYTYIHEHLTAPEEAKTRVSSRGNGVPSTAYVEVLDDTQIDFWRQLVEVPITVRAADPDATPGAQKLVYAPVTIRSIGGVDGRPFAGDTQADLGDQLTKEATAALFPRFARGAPTYSCEVAATPENLDLYGGQFVLVRFAPLPDYARGKRGLSRWMQIYALSDIDPSRRRVQLVDTGVVDVTDDPDVVAPGGEDCLTGGVLSFTQNGRAVRAFKTDGVLTNTCAHPVTVSVLLIGGGGSGGASPAGGGGGAGGVLVVDAFTIAAGAAIPMRPGSGGAPVASGEDSIMWASSAGLPLVPGVDPPNAALVGLGGGNGGNPTDTGGSGGGGGSVMPGSGGASTPGGAGDMDQGHAGGSGNSQGGIATCRSGTGGGGGSYASAGGAGVAVSPGAQGGAGGPLSPLNAWGVKAGKGGGGGAVSEPGASGPGICGEYFELAGAAGGLYGGGGGGAAGSKPATPGAAGIILVAYTGPAPALAPPVVTSTEVTDLNQVRVCITESDWLAVAIDDYRVRVDYAVGDTEPAPDSGDWRLAGYLDAPGCVTSVPVPTGAKVWSRAVAEASAFHPSEPSTPGDDDTPETPGLLAAALEIDDDGNGTATWGPNAFAGGVRVRGLIHDGATAADRPLPLLGDAAAAAGTFAVPGVVPEGEYETLDLEVWSAYGADPATPTAPEDSYVSRNSPVCNGVWAACRDGAGTEVQRTLNQIDVRIRFCGTANNLSGMWRGILTWNVAAYIDASTVTAATLTLFVMSKTETLAGQSVCLVGATPAAPGAHVAADYSTLGTTLLSDNVRTLASLTVGTFVTFTLNAAGRAAVQAAIAAGGSVSLGLRLEADRANAPPAWSANLDAVVSFASLNHATPANRPVLAITTAPVLSGTPGKTYRVSRLRPVRTTARTSDVIDPAHGGTGIVTYAVGDMLFADAPDHLTKLPGNVSVTPKYLRQTGTGAASAAPAWEAIAAPPPAAHTHDAADIVSGTLAYARLPTGGGTWANGGNLALTGGTVAITVGVVDLAALAMTGAAGSHVWAMLPAATGSAVATAGSLVFYNATVGAPRVTFGDTGFVDVTGLLANTPRLTVKGTDTATSVALHAGIGAAAGGSIGARVILNEAGPGGVRWDITNGGTLAGALSFWQQTASVEAMRLTATGATFAGSLTAGGTVSVTVPAVDQSALTVTGAAGSHLWAVLPAATSSTVGAAGSLVFYDGTAGTARVVFGPLGGIGVGGTPVGAGLDVMGPLAAAQSIVVRGSDTATAIFLQVAPSAADGGSVGARVIMRDSGTGGVRWDITNGGNAAGALSYMQQTAGAEALRLTATTVQFPSVATTASAANAFLDAGASNSLLRSTSAARYKRDVRPLGLKECEALVFGARPVAFRSRSPADDPAREFVGLVAEDLAALDSRFVHLWDGRPDGVSYDRLTVPLLVVVRQLRAELVELHARLDAHQQPGRDL